MTLLKTLQTIVFSAAAVAFLATPWFFDWRAGVVIAVMAIASIALLLRTSAYTLEVLDHAQAATESAKRSLAIAKEASELARHNYRWWGYTLLLAVGLWVFCVYLTWQLEQLAKKS